MESDEAMGRVIAGLGFRTDTAAGDIVTVVRAALVQAGRTAEALAVPDFKGRDAGVCAAADILGLHLILVTRDSLKGVQGRCLTRSEAARRAVGFASVAEAAALAACGADARLLLARISSGRATCALAEAAS